MTVRFVVSTPSQPMLGYLIGVEFSRHTRNVMAFEVADA